MKYVAIPQKANKPCVRYGCKERGEFMVVSRLTLYRRRTNPYWGIHYFACLEHLPATIQARHSLAKVEVRGGLRHDAT